MTGCKRNWKAAKCIRKRKCKHRHRPASTRVSSHAQISSGTLNLESWSVALDRDCEIPRIDPATAGCRQTSSQVEAIHSKNAEQWNDQEQIDEKLLLDGAAFNKSQTIQNKLLLESEEYRSILCADPMISIEAACHGDSGHVNYETIATETRSSVPLNANDRTPSSFLEDQENSSEKEQRSSITVISQFARAPLHLSGKDRRSSDTSPSILELEEFFEEHEKRCQIAFMTRYNFDPVNEVPIEGRFDWVRAQL